MRWVIVLLLFALLLFLWEYFLGSKAPPTDLKAEVKGSKVYLSWKEGFGIAKAYEVYVVEGGEAKMVGLFPTPYAELTLRPGTYRIYVRAIRPAGPSLESPSVTVTIEGSPPKIYGMRCKEGIISIVGEDIDECTYSNDSISWAPLQPFVGELRVNGTGTFYVRCLNKYGAVEGPVLCK